jgi:DNA-binding NarL/FixJ family response regulator
VTIRVLLVDDHELMRQGLRSILDREEHVEVVGEAAGGRAAVELARTLSPDVVVMDVAMKDLNGIEATRQIRAECPGVRVLALSSHSDTRYVAAILDAGACGYVLKANAYDDLRRALEAAHQGKSYLCPDVTQAVVGASLGGTGLPTDPAPASLSPREREVLQLLAEGLTSPQIGKRLFVATTTVETHRRNVMRKLGIHSVADLTKYAIREGLTPLDS